jgi:hypothetical protein
VDKRSGQDKSSGTLKFEVENLKSNFHFFGREEILVLVEKNSTWKEGSGNVKFYTIKDGDVKIGESKRLLKILICDLRPLAW